MVIVHVQKQQKAEDDDGDLDLERVLPLGILYLSDDEVGENIPGHLGTVGALNDQEPPLTSIKTLALSPPMELNAHAVPYRPSQSFRGPWPPASAPSRHNMSSPPAHPVAMQPSRNRGYFHQPPMMSQLGRGVKAVE